MDRDFYISEKDWNKIQNYAQEAYSTQKSEIGGMLVAIEDEDGDWELKDPVILKQQISAGNCVLDQDDLALYYTRAGSKLKNKNFRFVWWHSHHTMDAFWSGTDLTAIKEYSDGDFSFALVVNLKEEYKLRVSVWKPFEVHEDVDLTIITKEKKIPKKIQDEVADKCSPIVSQYGTWKKGTYTKGKSNQMTLAGTEDIKTGGPKSNPELSGDSEDYIYAYNMIDEMNKRYCDGRLTYEGWIVMAKDINALLKTKFSSPYRVELVTEVVLSDQVMLSTPHEYITVDPSIDPLFEEEYEDWLDYKSWNSSYGVR